jgi:hypothetical protein
MAMEAAGWLWGTAQGAFNQKAMLSQIITDAVIGMIPLVGDVTAARDIVAVSIRLVDQPKAREDKWEWVLLVVLLFALIPVFGGVVKGVGRIVIKVAGEAAQLVGAARAAHMAQAAQDIVALLNRVGAGNAERWLLKLKFADHQAAILTRLDNFVGTVNGALVAIERKLGRVLSEGIKQRIEGLMVGLGQLQVKAREMVPQSIKALDDTLREIQQYVRSGGQTTSRLTEHTVVAGDKATITMTDELRLTEGISATRSARGGIEKNKARLTKIEEQGFYKHEPGYPNLLAFQPEPGIASNVATFGGKIVNRPLAQGEKLFRVFGPEGITHGTAVGASFAPGRSAKFPNFWGLGSAPKNGKEFRGPSAVLDEWNHDGFIIVGTVREEGAVKACTGKIAEQTGKDIPGQYLPGGGKQAMFELPAEGHARLYAAGESVIATGAHAKLEVGGIAWEIKPTGWTDANGIHGYDLVALRAGVQTARLGAREEATKNERDAPPGVKH